jgi:hypothetical protein
MRARDTTKRRSRRRPSRRRLTTAKPIRLGEPLITSLLQLSQRSQTTGGGLVESVMGYYSPNALKTIQLFQPVLDSPNVPTLVKLPIGFLVGAALGQGIIDSAAGILGGKRRR